MCTADNRECTTQALQDMGLLPDVEALVCGDDAFSKPKPGLHILNFYLKFQSIIVDKCNIKLYMVVHINNVFKWKTSTEEYLMMKMTKKTRRDENAYGIRTQFNTIKENESKLFNKPIKMILSWIVA